MTERNWQPSTLYAADCLDVLRGLNSETFDLIYADPPSRDDLPTPSAESDVPASLRPVLSVASDEADRAYLAFMAPRLAEMKRLLTPDGALYLHCDPAMSHYLRIMLDGLFGRDRFREEFFRRYRADDSRTGFLHRHDTIYQYARDDHLVKMNGAPLSPSAYRNWTAWAKDGPLVEFSLSDSERVDFPTQRPVALLRRILKSSSLDGNAVLDPFAGSGTTMVAAAETGREWVGIEIDPEAVGIGTGRATNARVVTDPPERSDRP